MAEVRRILMCSPRHFAVDYVINPWMDGNIGRARQAVAVEQWELLRAHLQTRAEVIVMDGERGLPDLCFTANAGFVLEGRAMLARFSVRPRMPESAVHARWFEDLGLDTLWPMEDQPFEGEGDALVHPGGLDGRPVVWAGYGVRSSLESHRLLAETFGIDTIPLRLVDPRFYHLDTCLLPLPAGRVVFYPQAFSPRSLAAIRDRVPAQRRIEINEADARRFACNALCLGEEIIVNDASADLRQRLAAWGHAVTVIPVSEFLLAGGAVKCLTLLLDQQTGVSHARPRSAESSICTVRVEVTGHLLDQGILPRALDRIEEADGSFQLEHLRPAARGAEPSQATVRVTALDGPHLAGLMDQLRALGFREADPPVDAALEVVTQPGVAPEDFYTTTIYPTDVRVEGRWLRVRNQRMDATLRVRADSQGSAEVHCALMRDLQPGDRVVVGGKGIRVARQPWSPGDHEFRFMSNPVSSERRVEHLIDELGREMQRIRHRRGRIILVAGPVVVHTGGADYLARLVRAGYVSALLTGNALPVHDIELSLYGTSLGVDLKHGVGVHGGHQHHLRAINTVRRHGGIRAAVDAGVIRSGIMYECVRAEVPFVLAGSIRDDGPLPETLMDLGAAQQAYAQAIAGTDMILMLASMLHAIGVGNMTPAGVRLVCVDISPAVVTKLADRGSVESTGIVTDVGLFLSLLAQRLQA